jgi:hypothetical protein
VKISGFIFGWSGLLWYYICLKGVFCVVVQKAFLCGKRVVVKVFGGGGGGKERVFALALVISICIVANRRNLE